MVVPKESVTVSGYLVTLFFVVSSGKPVGDIGSSPGDGETVICASEVGAGVISFFSLPAFVPQPVMTMVRINPSVNSFLNIFI